MKHQRDDELADRSAEVPAALTEEPPVVSPEPAPRPPLRARVSGWFTGRVRWVIWFLYVAAWTRSLLGENPVNPGNNKTLEFQLFLFSKAVHITAYALFAALSGWLHVPFRSRWLLLAFMSLHAFATEYGQQFFKTRHPSLRDVALDHLGILLGVLLTLGWWRRAGHADPGA